MSLCLRYAYMFCYPWKRDLLCLCIKYSVSSSIKHRQEPCHRTVQYSLTSQYFQELKCHQHGVYTRMRTSLLKDTWWIHWTPGHSDVLLFLSKLNDRYIPFMRTRRSMRFVSNTHKENSVNYWTHSIGRRAYSRSVTNRKHVMEYYDICDNWFVVSSI